MITVKSDSEFLSEAVFDHFLTRHSELPQWLVKLKQQNWVDYLALPAPSRKMETWRFANVKGLGVDTFRLAQPLAVEEGQSLIERSNRLKNTSGKLIFGNDDLLAEEELSEDLKAKGVIFEPLERAFAQHSEILEEFFMAQESALGSEKFAALHTALNRNGTLLFVPENVEIDLPLVSYHWAQGSESAVFPHTLVIAKDNSKVTFVDVYGAHEKDSSQLACGVSTLYAGPGAQVEYHYLQNWNEASLSFNQLTTIAQRDSNIRAFGLNIGSKHARNEGHTIIDGPGSNAELFSLTVAHKDQEIDQRTLQSHNAANARSNLLFKNALQDTSKTIFSGLIKVAEEAQQTDAYQTNRNLLLSPLAEANSLPGLEILANDVKCSHGAATGQIDDNELFYLLSRGISKPAAQILLVFAFFEEILEKMENEELAEFHRELIHQKLENN
ncbi:MAG: Fe-S cluster assembly protein SufD [Verrucomicrobia bacterium]|nr:Fe-S cluster assembly protein SufD [Verrucomicrobiota bacterium]